MDCNLNPAAFGMLGSLLMFFPTLLQLLREENHTIQKSVVLSGICFIGMAFFIQCGFGPWWTWVVGIIAIVILITMFWPKFKKKNC